MKLDRFRTSSVIAAALAALLPVAAAQATDLYDSLKSLTNPSVQDARVTRDSPSGFGPTQRDVNDTRMNDTRSGAQGPYYQSDTMRQQPSSTIDQPATTTDQYPSGSYPSPNDQYAPSPSTTEERSP